MTSYTKASLVLLAVFFVSCACASPSGRNGKKWVLLAAGSNKWTNYRHQSDVCHAYQIARSHGIPQENIITMMYDDIAHNRNNPYPGQIFNSPAMVDNYRGVFKDYIGEDVTPQNFLNVLMGNRGAMQGIGTGKVVDSGPDDEIFVYFSDHGGKGLVAFPHDYLYASTLINALTQMAYNNRFNKMVFYLEACHSGSMFQQLPNNINVFATTAANADENSFSTFCQQDTKLDGICMADEYSWNWMNEIDNVNINQLTLDDQYEYVKRETRQSHPVKFGSARLGTLTLSNFLAGNSYGAELNMTVRQTPHHQPNAVPSHEAVFHYLRHQLRKAEGDTYEEFGAAMQLHREIEALARTRSVAEEIVETVAVTEERRREILEGALPLTLEVQACYESAADAFLQSGSFTDSEKGHALQHMQILVNLCSADWTTQEEIIDAIKSACRKAKLSDPLPLSLLLDEEEECWMGDAVCEAMCHARSTLGFGGVAGGCEDGVCKCV